MSGADDIEARRQRLREMRARRQVRPEFEAELDEPNPLTSRRGGGEGKRQADGGTAEQMRQKLAASRWIQNALAKASQRGGTPIPGTSFTEEAVVALLQKLRERANDTSGRGGPAAQRALRFLTRPSEGEPTVAGVSIDRLQKLSKAVGGAAGPAAAGPMRAGAGGGAVRPFGRGRQAIAAEGPGDSGDSARRIEEMEKTIARLERTIEQLTRQTAAAPAAPALRVTKVKRGSSGKAVASNANGKPPAALPEATVVNEQDQSWISDLSEEQKID
jgi:hypothetical protein